MSTLKKPVRTPESGGLEATQEGFIRTRVYSINHGDEDDLKEINDTRSNDGRLNTYTVDPGPAFDTLTETYLQDRNGDPIEEWPKEKGTKYFPLAEVIDRPLEEHKNYRTNWNNDLYAATAGDVPAWFATATDKSDDNGTDYIWSQSLPIDGWTKIASRTKPGVESWRDSIPKIIRQTYSVDYEFITTALLTLNRLITPGKVFVYTDLQWLVSNVTISQDGIWYVAELEYTGALAWDTDIYE